MRLAAEVEEEGFDRLDAVWLNERLARRYGRKKLTARLDSLLWRFKEKNNG